MGSSLRGVFPVHDPLPAKLHWLKPGGGRVHLDPLLEPYIGTTVYRYGTVAEALMLLREGAWTFLRPASWPDPYEKYVARQLFGDAAPFEALPGYVKCVSLEYSSEAMWRTYATTGGLVRISWTLEDLITELDRADWGVDGEVYLGAVRYLKPQAIRDEVKRHKAGGDKGVLQRAMRVLMMKRFGFAFENEVRVCFFPKTRASPPVVWKAIGFRRDKVQGMLVDPYLSAWQAEELAKLFLDELRVPFKVAQSQFDTVYDGLP